MTHSSPVSIQTQRTQRNFIAFIAFLAHFSYAIDCVACVAFGWKPGFSHLWQKWQWWDWTRTVYVWRINWRLVKTKGWHRRCIMRTSYHVLQRDGLSYCCCRLQWDVGILDRVSFSTMRDNRATVYGRLHIAALYHTDKRVFVSFRWRPQHFPSCRCR